MTLKHKLTELGFYCVLLGMLSLLAGFSWLTHHPETEIVRRAESWPVVGPLARVFRSKYVPQHGARRSAESDAESDEDGVVVRRRAPEIQAPPGGEPMWLLRGTELRRRPALDAKTFYVVDRIASASQLERRDVWYRVYLDGREGWVYLPDYDPARDPPYGEAPDPPGPLPARLPDPETLAVARELLGERQRVIQLGPYTTYTDVGSDELSPAEPPTPRSIAVEPSSQAMTVPAVGDDELLVLLGQLADRVGDVYRARFGRAPIGRPRAALVLYRAELAYRMLQSRSSELAGLASSGHHGGGLVVSYVGDRQASEVAATVVHELVHSLNRRAIGPALPPWLDEGLADDLAMSRLTPEHQLDPASLSGSVRLEGDLRVIDGGLGALWSLLEALQQGTLPSLHELVRLDWDGFVRSPAIALHYDTSAFLVRFLLEGENGRRAPAFRAYLTAIAKGEPASPENLERWLGQNLATLDTGFRSWLDYRARLEDLPR